MLANGNRDNIWFTYKKLAITASHTHDVLTRCVTVRGSCNNLDGFRAIFAKISGKVRINPKLLALKFGRSMEDEAVGFFAICFSKSRKNV